MPPTDEVDRYHFPVGGGVVIHGNTLDKLIQNVFEYRIRNNIEPGNIEADIDAYYCAKWPTFCHDDKAGVGLSATAQAKEMLNRVSRWISSLVHRMPRGGFLLVLASEAEERAIICAGCPRNGNWRSGCGGCDAATLQLLQQVKSLRKTSRDGNLGACQIGGWEMSSAVHLPSTCTPITDEQRAEMPANCWRKALP